LKRLRSLDRLRALAVVAMIEVHVVNALLAEDRRATPAFRALDFANGLVAPAFLFAAGAGLGSALSSKAPFAAPPAAKSIVLRAGPLLLLGYLLHISGLISYLGHRDSASLSVFLQCDILQVFAVGFALLGALAAVTANHVRRFQIGSLALAGLAILVESRANAVSTSLPYAIAPYLRAMESNRFALTPWLAHLFLGAAIGSARGALSPKPLLAIGSIALATGVLAHVDPLSRFGLVALITALLAALEERDLPLEGPISLFARRSLLVYVVHVGLVYGHHPLSLLSRLGPGQSWTTCLAAWVAVTAAMYLLARAWDAYSRRRAEASTAR
jgi:uncharacterized membrane protein